MAMHAALADPARLRITDMLADGDASPSELAAVVAMPSNLLAHHLRVLEEAGLLEQTPDGRVRRCALKAAPLSAAFGWLFQYRLFWEGTLDALAKHLET